MPAAIPRSLRDRMQHCQGDTVSSLEQRKRKKSLDHHFPSSQSSGGDEIVACWVHEATFTVNSPTKPCHVTETSRVMGWRLAGVSVHTTSKCVCMCAIISECVPQRAGIMASISDFMWLAMVGCGWLTCRRNTGASACECSRQRKVFLLGFAWQHRSRLTVTHVYHGSMVNR